MRKISIIFPYYMNPTMLKLQFETLNDYPEEIRQNIQLIVVDDGSPVGYRAEEYISRENLKAKDFDFQLYRIMTDLRWNQDGAKNLGALHASHEWLVLTDIDHLIYAGSMAKIMEAKIDPNVFYSFTRVMYQNKGHKKAHPNSYLMSRELYWRIGGYDEIYCGHYGTDGMFKRKCLEFAECKELKIPLTLVGRDDVPDASTTTLVRKDQNDKDDIYHIRHYKLKNSIPDWTCRLPWKRVL